MGIRAKALLVVPALFVLATAAHANVVREVVVAENTKTTDETVLYIAGVDVGDDWNLDLQEEVRLELISSGLFKEVDVFSEPHPKGGVRVTILARDKHSWIIAPTYYNQPTNKGFGLGFGENNLFGLNKKLLAYGQIATGDSFFVGGYRDPSLFGLPIRMQLDTFLRKERVLEYAPEDAFIVTGKTRGNPRIVRESKIRFSQGGLKLGVEILRSLSFDARFRAAKISYTKPKLGPGAKESEVDANLDDGCSTGNDVSCELPKPGRAGWDVTLAGAIQFSRMANYYGVTNGDRYALSYESTVSALGSDFDYWIAQFNLTRARRYFSTGNLILKANVSVGEDLPFHAEFTSGGTDLRGYQNRQFRGDFRAAGKVEYSVELFNIKGLGVRPLLFADTTYTRFFNTADAEAENIRNYLPGYKASALAGFRNSAGMGMRLYIRQIVLPLLGLDVGYGFESGGIEVYFAIGLTDV